MKGGIRNREKLLKKILPAIVGITVIIFLFYMAGNPFLPRRGSLERACK
jgi:hypothetical protein